MPMAEEKYDKNHGLYYDHKTLYDKRNKDDPRDITRRALENLHEQVLLNNKRINDLTDRCDKFCDDLGEFIHHINNKEENK